MPLLFEFVSAGILLTHRVITPSEFLGPKLLPTVGNLRLCEKNFGENDEGSPIEYVNEGIQRIAQVYEEMEAKENFTSFVQEGVGHVLSDEMWEKTKRFFNKHLKF